MPIAPIWIALSLALSISPEGGSVGDNAMPSFGQAAMVSQASPLMSDTYVFSRKGRRNPFERPSTAPPQIGERLTYHQQISLLRKARGLLSELRKSHGFRDRSGVLARYDQLLYLRAYQFGIEELKNQLMDTILQAQPMVAQATTEEVRSLLTRIQRSANAGETEQSLVFYRHLVNLTSPDRFTNNLVKQQMLDLRKQANEHAKGLIIILARCSHADMERWMAEGQFEKVGAEAENLNIMLKDQPLEAEEKEEAQQLMAKAQELRNEATLQMQFAKEEIFVSAVVYTTAHPTAIVNDTVVREGDTIKGVAVTQICPETVVFSYRGQQIARTLSNQQKPTKTDTQSKKGIVRNYDKER